MGNKHHIPRIAVIGASSIAFGPLIINDLLQQSFLKEGMCIVLMAPHKHKLSVIERWARSAAAATSASIQVEAVTTHREALRGADIVILMFDNGGFPAYDADYRVTATKGIHCCIGDTMGPTAIMMGLRNIALLKELSSIYQQECPDAWLLNYVNPMAPMMIAASELGIKKTAGICGGVKATHNLIAHCLSISPDILKTEFAGINHMSWALSVEAEKRDMYPEFRRKFLLPQWRAAEPARSEILQNFGYFPTETSGHITDMLPWFRKDSAALQKYASVTGYAGESGMYHRYNSFLYKKKSKEDYLMYETGLLGSVSTDHGVNIIAAILEGNEYSGYGNIINSVPHITNLPNNICVEVPIVVKNRMISSIKPIALPLQLAALCEINCIVHSLIVQAALQSDQELVAVAFSLDPLTQSVLDLPGCRSLASQLLEQNAHFLPKDLGAPMKKLLPVGGELKDVLKERISSDIFLNNQLSPMQLLKRYDANKQKYSHKEKKIN